MIKFLKIDSQLIKRTKPILHELGIDIDTLFEMTLTRVIHDQNISFLAETPESTDYAISLQQETLKSNDRISKNQAISIFENLGICLNHNVTYASKNRGAFNYWANPNFTALDTDWFLILNDWQKRELHLFLIPANAIKQNQMICRADQPDKIDLQICYNDPLYTDNRSKIIFQPYWIKSHSY